MDSGTTSGSRCVGPCLAAGPTVLMAALGSALACLAATVSAIRVVGASTGLGQPVTVKIQVADYPVLAECRPQDGGHGNDRGRLADLPEGHRAVLGGLGATLFRLEGAFWITER